jgi:2-hydroxymuconate-semialdehyde hydrolase
MAFIETEHAFAGLTVRGVQAGRPGAPALLLLHGSGPGASSLGNFRAVIEPLAERFHVHAMDLIGFGRSDRKPAPPFFDYPLWLAQCRDMLGRMPGESVGVIGHSLSGSFALRLAASEPRVGRVMTTATLGARFAGNPTTFASWSVPRDRAQLVESARRLIADPARIDDAWLAQREQVLFAGDYRAYCEAMFAGDRQTFIDQAALTGDELASIVCPVLLVHGREDMGYPYAELSLALGERIADADVALLGRCSHSVAFEQPAKFLALARSFFAS